MLVSDFKVNSRLKILKGIFSGIHGMPQTRMHIKKDTLPYNEGSHALLTTTTKLLDINYEFYGSSGDFIETNTVA